MPDLQTIGRWLVVAGIGLAVMGGIIWLLARVLPAGTRDLPGTIRIEGAGLTCVIPLLASIVLSIVFTIILNLAARFLNK
jgi:hypothetical protein